MIVTTITTVEKECNKLTVELDNGTVYDLDQTTDGELRLRLVQPAGLGLFSVHAEREVEIRTVGRARGRWWQWLDHEEAS